jgi:hypothetical protein
MSRRHRDRRRFVGRIEGLEAKGLMAAGLGSALAGAFDAPPDFPAAEKLTPPKTTKPNPGEVIKHVEPIKNVKPIRDVEDLFDPDEDLKSRLKGNQEKDTAVDSEPTDADADRHGLSKLEWHKRVTQIPPR